VPRILEPSNLRPVELDLRRVFGAIMGLWAVALLVLGVVGLVGSVEGRSVAICATGLALGFPALAWERRRARR